MAMTSWRNWVVAFGFATHSIKRTVRGSRHPEIAFEQLEARMLLSAASAGAALAADVAHANANTMAGTNHAKAASIPNIAGPWLLTGESQTMAFTNAALTITQSGKTGKTIAGSAMFTGGSIEFTGKLRPNGHITGKTTIHFGEQTLSRQHYFADLTDNLLTFSGEVNLKSLDDIMNIDGVRVVP